jgi:signal transduction histidine kinase
LALGVVDTAALLLIGVSPWVVLGLAAGGFLAYPAGRRVILDWLDRSALSDRRGRAVVTAAEAERGRLARELHDAPLQDLAVVIQRLDAVPLAASEASALREIAERIRTIATDLRPPILDDVGLAPALTALAQHAREVSGIKVEIWLHDATDGARATRPPTDVEVASFRVAQEAVANAIRHSRATSVEIGSSISADHVDLFVRDDGIGISNEAVREAQRRGHMGLMSMRERAAAVGAAIRVTRTRPAGTIVHLRWPAR